MKSRIFYQALLFFNSTFLYSFVFHSTGSRVMLFFSAFVAALSLVANLAVQLSSLQFQSVVWLLKVVSILLLSWVCLRTGITPPVFALGVGVLTIAFTHRDAFVGSPNRLSIIVVLVPIAVTSLWLVLSHLGMAQLDGESILLLLIFPYLLTAVTNRPKSHQDSRSEILPTRIQASTLILSQLLPTASSFVMLGLISHESDAAAMASFVMMERAVAIGGSAIYFYARVKGVLAKMAVRVVLGFLLLAGMLVISMVLAVPTLLCVGVYLVAGMLLSYGTISLGAQNSYGILVINCVALLSLLLVPESFAGLKPIQLFAIYICPQLLLMGALLVLSSRKNA